ncbi:AMP-binding protein [Amaricoccus sp.]|uniref:AMP-binding protein n=1 Tax=Amaricoccus sp. TaxID=1872485 RepID=UPI001B74D3AB|nr:AMP-binding protein [Amaricoccus sp.]MBP7001497.1 AMP-binding protein [Amaricoccus sp.]
MPHAHARLAKTAANYAPLTPVVFLRKAAATHPDHPAVVYGEVRRSWAETAERCRRLASALEALGLKPGETVAVMAANTPELYEAHFGVPLARGVLCTINTRLDADTVAYILDHAEAKVFLVDREFGAVALDAVARSAAKPVLVDIADPAAPGAAVGRLEYEEILAGGDPAQPWRTPDDEWDAIAVNYTSGTTGRPKGVVYHHRGAYLNALGNTLEWDLGMHPTYLWTLPMFHCNGWCFPWTIAAKAGTNVCLRRVTARTIYDAIADEGVDHLCGAPIVLGFMINATAEDARDFPQRVAVMTAAAPPPASVLQAMAERGFDVTHVYGLTEVYGPAVACAWKRPWNALPMSEQARLKSRQGVAYVVEEEVVPMDPASMVAVDPDGATMGEVMFRGNIVMKGYLKDPEATEKAFAGGWFHSGDLGVRHPDGYIELKDRAKDIIISGGENISSIEIENALMSHPAVALAAVVARPDEKWGETPCAFVELKAGAEAAEAELIAWCRARMAHFKAPRRVVFEELPKTSTGKIQKGSLRTVAAGLPD